MKSWTTIRAVPEPTITYQGTTLPVRPEFRYLGITIKSNRWLADCALSLSVSANKALMALWHKTRAMGIRNPDTLCRLFKIIVLPVGNYACQAWAVDNLNMSSAKRILDNPLQKVVIYFLRLLSGCSPNTCSWSLPVALYGSGIWGMHYMSVAHPDSVLDSPVQAVQNLFLKLLHNAPPSASRWLLHFNVDLKLIQHHIFQAAARLCHGLKKDTTLLKNENLKY